MAPDMRESFDMTLLRMLAFRPDSVGASNTSVSVQSKPVTAPPVLPSNPAAASEPIATTTSIQSVPAAPVPVVTPSDAPPLDNKGAAEPASSRGSAMAKIKASLAEDTPRNKGRAAEKKSPEKLKPPAVAPSKPPVTPPNSGAHNEVAVLWADKDWSSILSQLSLTGMRAEMAKNCILKSIDENTVTLALVKQHASLLQPGTVKQIESALSGVLGQAIKLDVLIEDGDLSTPAKEAYLANEERLKGAREAIASDPVVQKICQQTEGAVQSNSVKPHHD
jgi:DNA polymerase-3 subunit gamma/tau